MLMRYPGGKSRGSLTRQLLQLIQERYQGGTFGELFFGSGGITFQLLKKKAIKNSLSTTVIPT